MDHQAQLPSGVQELTAAELEAVVGGAFNTRRFIDGAAGLGGAGVLGWGAAGAAAVGIGTVGVAALGVGAVGLAAWGAYNLARSF